MSLNKLLITGSSGYIGTNLKQKLKGYEIIEVDKKIGIDVYDLTEKDLKGLAGVVHLAAISGIKECDEDKNKALQNNVLTTSHLLAKMNLHIPFIFASSQAVKNPTNHYAYTKQSSEKLIKALSRRFNILRFSNVYGGVNYLESKTSVVANFINAKKQNKPLIINGDGSQTRDFIHVDDVCKVIIKSITHPLNMTFDVGTGIGTSIKSLAEMIGGEIVYNECNMKGVESSISDTLVMDEMLGADEPRLKIEDYINDERRNALFFNHNFKSSINSY
jgi:UDP-glucose 4-epimerase